MSENLITCVEYLQKDETLLAFVTLREHSKVDVILNGTRYREVDNDAEPYEFLTHKFLLPKAELERAKTFTLDIRLWDGMWSCINEQPREQTTLEVVFDASKIIPYDEAVVRSNRHLKFDALLQEGGEEISYQVERYLTDKQEPVIVYTALVNPKKATFTVGLPFGKLECDGSRQTVVEIAQTIQEQGNSVLAAVNGDYFDIQDTKRVVGACVTRGHTVNNPDLARPFFGVTKGGIPVITTKNEAPMSEFSEAISGKHIIVKDGKVNEIDPLCRFGEVTHPRTAVGLTKDGDVLIIVVDGRRPAWSNGASLFELANIMIEKGVTTALNLDGGGSSTFVVGTEEGLQTLNHPTNLGSEEDYVRTVPNSLVVIKK